MRTWLCLDSETSNHSMIAKCKIQWLITNSIPDKSLPSNNHHLCILLHWFGLAYTYKYTQSCVIFDKRIKNNFFFTNLISLAETFAATFLYRIFISDLKYVYIVTIISAFKRGARFLSVQLPYKCFETYVGWEKNTLLTFLQIAKESAITIKD